MLGIEFSQMLFNNFSCFFSVYEIRSAEKSHIEVSLSFNEANFRYITEIFGKSMFGFNSGKDLLSLFIVKFLILSKC